jgi:hypothetical protein
MIYRLLPVSYEETMMRGLGLPGGNAETFAQKEMCHLSTLMPQIVLEFPDRASSQSIILRHHVEVMIRYI